MELTKGSFAITKCSHQTNVPITTVANCYVNGRIEDSGVVAVASLLPLANNVEYIDRWGCPSMPQKFLFMIRPHLIHDFLGPPESLIRPSVCPSMGLQQQTRCCRFAAVCPAGRRYRSMIAAAAACAAGECGQCHVVSVRRQLNADLLILALGACMNC